MKPHIQRTSFGSITIGDNTNEYDVLIRSNGEIEKRKKKLSKKVYGTSLTFSIEEAEFINEEGIQKRVIGSGQYVVLKLSGKAEQFFAVKEVSMILKIHRMPFRSFKTPKNPVLDYFM